MSEAANFIITFKENASGEDIQKYKDEVTSEGGEINREFNGLMTGFSAKIQPQTLQAFKEKASLDGSPIQFIGERILRSLQVANEQQSAYGLRYDDFARYRHVSFSWLKISAEPISRKHCANRTHRLRSSLKITHSSSKGRDFRKLPPITELPVDKVKDDHLQLLLIESERAWAYAQELISSSLLPANANNAASLRHHATGRFRRSIHWATQLLSLAQTLYTADKLTAESLLQVTAYVLLLNGRFLLSREDFESALPQLSVTRRILDILADHATTSKDHALAVLWADQVGPMIRWSAHQMGREKAYDVDSIVAQVAKENVKELVDGWDGILKKFRDQVEPGDANTAAAAAKKDLGKAKLDQSKLMWEGENVPVRNPELVDMLLKVQSAEAKFDSTNIAGNKGNAGKKAVAAYDAVLAALSDAEEVAKKLSESEAQKASSSTIPTNLNPGGGTIRDMHFVHTYIVYQLLSKRIQRDLLLVDALTKEASASPIGLLVGPKNVKSKAKHSRSSQQVQPVDPRLYPAIVKLFDTILQSLTQMRTLSIVDDNPDLSASVEGRTAWTKARRCLILARCYDVPGIKKYAEALTILQHASVHLREVRGVASSLDLNDASLGKAFYPISPSEIDELDGVIAREGMEYKRAWLEKGSSALPDGEGKQQQQTQKKPVFFNIALNYIDVDIDKLRERAGKAPAPATPAAAAAPSSKAPSTTPQNSKAGSAAAVAQRKALAEGLSRSGTPEPRDVVDTQAQNKPLAGGNRLGSLLGGWWGRS
ncbi:hypothetical protein D9757_000578 [Collybiopsis confluens]|uniref:Signal recognition particle subunit SRP68 n=1 Tax=Collybiopsis confluens TaxID=2823264 RepID=A0A8H5MGW7_9AGAR|nr:hypothetical protein D9757_000578 [Collybiopsis confluens]